MTGMYGYAQTPAAVDRASLAFSSQCPVVGDELRAPFAGTADGTDLSAAADGLQALLALEVRRHGLRPAGG